MIQPIFQPLSIANPAQFSARARQLHAEAERICRECPDSDLDQWMLAAKAQGMTWVEGLAWIIERHLCEAEGST